MARQGKRNASVTKLIPSLGVSDIDRSVGFYRQFFGFRVVDSYEAEGHMPPMNKPMITAGSESSKPFTAAPEPSLPIASRLCV